MARFLLMAAAVLVAGMVVVGLWVTSKIEEGVTDNAGAVTALYVDALVTPVVQELAVGDVLGPRHLDELQRILRRGALSDQISVFKLWTPGGRIVFSDNPELMGQELGTSPGLEDALAGRVHTSFERTYHNYDSGGDGVPLLEVYSPVRSVVDGQVIAVAEFYTSAEALAGHLMAARFQTWIVVGLVSLGMFLVLSLVVAGGSRTIARQRQSLDAQVSELSVLLDKNSALTQRVEQANHRIAAINEDNLRRISADLHDGPVQQLAFAALRLDPGEGARQAEVRSAIDEAMKEIRHICSGLALPELEEWSVATIARRLAATHETRTKSKVAIEGIEARVDLSLAGKICFYRFIQEALNNSAKHAEGARQTIRLLADDALLSVEIEDDGPGFDPAVEPAGLGLAGLRERVAGLKGSLEVDTRMGRGTILRMRLPVAGDTP